MSCDGDTVKVIGEYTATLERLAEQIKKATDAITHVAGEDDLRVLYAAAAGVQVQALNIRERVGLEP